MRWIVVTGLGLLACSEIRGSGLVGGPTSDGGGSLDAFWGDAGSRDAVIIELGGDGGRDRDGGLEDVGPRDLPAPDSAPTDGGAPETEASRQMAIVAVQRLDPVEQIPAEFRSRSPFVGMEARADVLVGAPGASGSLLELHPRYSRELGHYEVKNDRGVPYLGAAGCRGCFNVAFSFPEGSGADRQAALLLMEMASDDHAWTGEIPFDRGASFRGTELYTGANGNQVRVDVVGSLSFRPDDVPPAEQVEPLPDDFAPWDPIRVVFSEAVEPPDPRGFSVEPVPEEPVTAAPLLAVRPWGETLLVGFQVFPGEIWPDEAFMLRYAGALHEDPAGLPLPAWSRAFDGSGLMPAARSAHDFAEGEGTVRVWGPQTEPPSGSCANSECLAFSNTSSDRAGVYAMVKGPSFVEIVFDVRVLAPSCDPVLAARVSFETHVVGRAPEAPPRTAPALFGQTGGPVPGWSCDSGWTSLRGSVRPNRGAVSQAGLRVQVRSLGIQDMRILLDNIRPAD